MRIVTRGWCASNAQETNRFLDASVKLFPVKTTADLLL
jgi:hypothetical protein